MDTLQDVNIAMAATNNEEDCLEIVKQCWNSDFGDYWIVLVLEYFKPYYKSMTVYEFGTDDEKEPLPGQINNVKGGGEWNDRPDLVLIRWNRVIDHYDLLTPKGVNK